MAWNNANEIVVASNGQCYVAPVGTPLPATSVVALNAAFTGLGFVTEDGAAVTVTPEVSDYMAWQSRSPVRREKTSQEAQVALSLMQWNEQTVPAALGGGTVSGTAGNYRYDLPDDNAALAEIALVLDAVDGSCTCAGSSRVATPPRRSKPRTSVATRLPSRSPSRR
jgi:hypothetical protein